MQDPTYLALSNPLARPWHFTGLELVMLASLAITLAHAISRARPGERWHLFQWLVAFLYGVAMELIAFNYLNNYDHAQFTIQLYHRKLPFYVVCLYPTLHYVGIELVQRWKLSVVSEALLTGFAICLLDIPFDVAGIAVGWWRWSSSDPILAIRWLGVPITSYYWYLIFGAVFALLSRLYRVKLAHRSALWFAIAPVFSIGIIVGGTIGFLPFHGLRALHVPPEAIVAAHLALCAVLALWLRPQEARPLDAPSAIALVFAAFHVAVVVEYVARGQSPSPLVHLATVFAAALATCTFVRPIPRKPARVLAADHGGAQ